MNVGDVRRRKQAEAEDDRANGGNDSAAESCTEGSGEGTDDELKAEGYGADPSWKQEGDTNNKLQVRLYDPYTMKCWFT